MFHFSMHVSEKNKICNYWSYHIFSIGNLQFNGLVPHDDVSRQNEGLNVDDVCVSTLCSNIKPFTLKGEMAKCDPRDTKEETELVYKHSERVHCLCSF